MGVMEAFKALPCTNLLEMLEHYVSKIKARNA